MTLDQAVALSLLEDLPRVGLTARLVESDPELVERASPLLDRARDLRLRAAQSGIGVLAWNDPLMPLALWPSATHHQRSGIAVRWTA